MTTAVRGTASAIPLARPEIGPAEEAAVLEVLRSGQLSMGARTEALEAAWAAYCGVGHAVLMANGTVALESLLRALGVGAGDEVVTVSFSFNATASAILRVGATPVFIDVRDDDFCMDSGLVASVITPRTKAILPVHLYGLMADMAELEAIANRHGLVLIEDAAQAIGARFDGRSAGQFGSAMFSLYATKNVAAGEGGMVTTDDEDVAQRLRLERNHGMQTRHHHAQLASNSRPTDIAAAIALVQLEKLEAAIDRRRENAARLTAGLAGYLVPSVPARRLHSWHQYTVRFAHGRDDVLQGLRERGIGAEIYYPIPIHRQAYIDTYLPQASALPLPVTDRLAGEVLSLPVRPNLTADEIDRIIEAVHEVAPIR
ncbi:MAG: DegT/DnrJ/EryC1/StrS family aminotransferase [Candidatus Limnocylindrales bacterium]